MEDSDSDSNDFSSDSLRNDRTENEEQRLKREQKDMRKRAEKDFKKTQEKEK